MHATVQSCQSTFNEGHKTMPLRQGCERESRGQVSSRPCIHTVSKQEQHRKEPWSDEALLLHLPDPSACEVLFDELGHMQSSDLTMRDQGGRKKEWR